MSVVGRLINMWAKSTIITSRASLIQRLMIGLAAIAVYVVFAAMITGIFLFGACYCIHQALMAQGMSTFGASLVIGGVLLLFIAGLFLLARQQWIRTRDLPREIIVAGTPINHHVHNVVEAFIDGFGRRLS